MEWIISSESASDPCSHPPFSESTEMTRLKCSPVIEECGESPVALVESPTGGEPVIFAVGCDGTWEWE